MIAAALNPWPPLLQDEFIFRIEGTGALDCSTIVTTALDILCSKLRNLQYHVNKDDLNNDDAMDED
jgi:hypothetical protein